MECFILGHFNPLPYKNQIEVILRSVIEAGMNLEVNTSGIRQHPAETYPSQQILEWYFDMGGRNIAIGSDSHIIDNVGSGIPEALILVSKVGFSCVASYNKRVRSLLPINDLIKQHFEEESQSSGNDNE